MELNGSVLGLPLELELVISFILGTGTERLGPIIALDLAQIGSNRRCNFQLVTGPIAIQIAFVLGALGTNRLKMEQVHGF